MIELKDITKIYLPNKGDKVEALKEVSLTLGDAGLCFIVGKSGSGKSTLLNMLGGLDAPTSGEISVDGRTLNSFSRKESDEYRRKKVGFVFQDYNLLEELSVSENLELAMGLCGEKEGGKSMEGLLDSVELSGYGGRRIAELSGGQKQRVAVARALVKSPKIVLADEPTGNLDSATSISIFELLKNLSQDRLIAVVTHDLEAAKTYGDRIIELVDGKVYSDSAPANETAISVPPDVKGKASLSFGKIIRLGLSFCSKHYIRMAVSVLLFAFALALFGTGYTAASYDASSSEYHALLEHKQNLISLSSMVSPKSKLDTNQTHTSMTAAQTDMIEKELPEFDFKKIYNFDGSEHVYMQMSEQAEYDWFPMYRQSGMTALTEEELPIYGAKLIAGRMPAADNEIALPLYLCDNFMRYGIRDNNTGNTSTVNEYAELCGKEVNCYPYYNGHSVSTIVGVIDTGFDFKPYEKLKNVPAEYTQSEYNELTSLASQLGSVMCYSIHSATFVTEERIHGTFFEKPLTYARFGVNPLLAVYGLTSSGGTAKSFASITKDEIILAEGKDFSRLADDEVILSKEKMKILYINTHIGELVEDVTDEALAEFIAGGSIELPLMISEDGSSKFNENKTKIFKVAGYVYSESEIFAGSFYFADSALKEKVTDEHIVASMYTVLSGNKQKDMKLVKFSNDENIDGDYFFPIRWEVRSVLEGNRENSDAFRQLGLYSSLAFLVFAMLMIMNFVSASINSSRKQIGILRALGASKAETAAIYSVEAALLGIIAFALAIGATFGISELLNKLFVREGVYIPMLIVGYKQILTMFGVSIAACALGSLIPIIKISKKKPVEIIRG